MGRYGVEVLRLLLGRHLAGYSEVKRHHHQAQLLLIGQWPDYGVILGGEVFVLGLEDAHAKMQLAVSAKALGGVGA